MVGRVPNTEILGVAVEFEGDNGLRLGVKVVDELGLNKLVKKLPVLWDG